jgi:hypothetical protein
MLRIIVFCIGLMIAVPAWADPAADCNQSEDQDLRIKCCSELISQGGGTKQNLAVA